MDGTRRILEADQADVRIWALPTDLDYLDAFPLPPIRRRHRNLYATRAEFLWSLLTVSLLVWMTFVALTLWH